MKTAYVLVVYDGDGNRAAAFNDVANPSYNRSKNSADQVNIDLPRKSDRVSEIDIGRRFEIIRGSLDGTETIEETGFISAYGYTGDIYQVEGFTEEVFLTNYLTPGQYGYPLYSENAKLDTFFDQFARGYLVERVKRNWADYEVDSTNVDTTSNPDFALLQGSGDPTVYPSSGSITLRFEKESDELWDRIRWVSDYDDEAGLRTTIQYRQGSSAGAGTWSSEEAGALTDIRGIIVPQDDGNYMDVRVNFESDDEEWSPVLFSLEVIKRTAPILTVDYETYATIDPGTLSTPGIETDNRNLLEVLIDVCDEADWQFRVRDGTLYFSEDFGVDRSDDYTLIES